MEKLIQQSRQAAKLPSCQAVSVPRRREMDSVANSGAEIPRQAHVWGVPRRLCNESPDRYLTITKMFISRWMLALMQRRSAHF